MGIIAGLLIWNTILSLLWVFTFIVLGWHKDDIKRLYTESWASRDKINALGKVLGYKYEAAIVRDIQHWTKVSTTKKGK